MKFRRVSTAVTMTILLAWTLVAGTSEGADATSRGRHMLVHHDLRHDVDISNPRTGNDHVARHRRDGDITTVRARYGRHDLRIHMYLAALSEPRGRHDGSGTGLIIESHGGPFWAIETLYDRAHLHGSTEIDRGSETAVPVLKSDTCAGLEAFINYAAARVSYIVPAHCIDRTPSVRVGLIMSGEHHGLFWFDDAFGGRYNGDGDKSRPIYRQ